MKRITLVSHAESEIEEILDWYNERSPSAATRFLDELEAALDRIGERPRSYPVIAQVGRGRDVRRARCARSPYAIVFAELDEVIVVAAVVHLKRRPLYWVERLGTLG